MREESKRLARKISHSKLASRFKRAYEGTGKQTRASLSGLSKTISSIKAKQDKKAALRAEITRIKMLRAISEKRDLPKVNILGNTNKQNQRWT